MKVLCTLPNASAEISGVKFSEHANGMLSEDVTKAVADGFADIPGYTIVGEKSAEKLAAEKLAASEKLASDKAVAEAAEAEEKSKLLERAAAVNMPVKSTWGIPRLKSEVESAEKDAAEAAAAAAKDKPAADADKAAEEAAK